MTKDFDRTTHDPDPDGVSPKGSSRLIRCWGWIRTGLAIAEITTAARGDVAPTIVIQVVLFIGDAVVLERRR